MHKNYGVYQVFNPNQLTLTWTLTWTLSHISSDHSYEQVDYKVTITWGTKIDVIIADLEGINF